MHDGMIDVLADDGGEKKGADGPAWAVCVAVVYKKGGRRESLDFAFLDIGTVVRSNFIDL